MAQHRRAHHHPCPRPPRGTMRHRCAAACQADRVPRGWVSFPLRLSGNNHPSGTSSVSWVGMRDTTSPSSAASQKGSWTGSPTSPLTWCGSGPMSLSRGNAGGAGGAAGDHDDPDCDQWRWPACGTGDRREPGASRWQHHGGGKQCRRAVWQTLRACLKRSYSGCQTPHHQLNHGDPDPCLSRLWQRLEIFTQPA